MPQISDLMGLGMAGALAGQIGHTRYPAQGGTPLVGIGTTQGAIASNVTSSTTLAPAAGNTAYTLPNPNTLVKPFYLYNPTAVAGALFPLAGGSINGGAANASVAIPANGYVIAICASMNGGVAQWFVK